MLVLSDGDRIRNLLGAYCRLIDRADFTGLGRLMERARLCTEDGTPIATGFAEVCALYTGLVRRHGDDTPRTQHLVLNTTFDDPATADVAVTRSTYVVLQATDGLPLQPIVTGAYVDTFGRDDDGSWHFTERRFGIRLVGDTGHHLRNAPL